MNFMQFYAMPPILAPGNSLFNGTYIALKPLQTFIYMKVWERFIHILYIYSDEKISRGHSP